MRKLKNRLAVLRLLLVLLFCAVAVYLAWLMQKPELLQAAAGQGSYTCTAGTAAGTIYDRNGVPLVNTRSVCTAVVSPTPEAAEALLPHVLDVEAFYEKLAQGKPFTCTVDTADIACPDVTVLEIPQRYTTPQPAQHVIGYTQEGKGVAGLESAYDAVLRGVDSQWSVTFSVDGKGKPLAGEAAQVRYGANPVQGVMTLSYDLRDNDVWGMLKDSFSLIVNDIPVDVLFSASGVACEDFSGMTPDEKERAPKAVFSSQYHGFGTMKAGGEPKREFTITNQGKEPLRIRDMKLGDRMSTTLDPDRAIAPGETVSFVAMLSTKNAPAGRLMDHIVLILNDPSRPLREIRLAATIVP